jgi:hypothetical protein
MKRSRLQKLTELGTTLPAVRSHRAFNASPHNTSLMNTDSIAQLPRDIVLKFPNRTWPASESTYEGYYVAAPDVFHALHCLVIVIQTI